MSYETLPASETNLIEQLKEKFKAPDNFLRLVDYENLFIWKEKASLLIYLSIFNGEINSFMGRPVRNSDGLNIFKLRKPIRVFKDFNFNGFDYHHEYIFEEMYIKAPGTSSVPSNRWSNQSPKIGFKNDSLFGLYLDTENPYIHLVPNNNNLHADLPIKIEKHYTLLCSALDEARLIFSKIALFDLCKDITPHKTPKDVISYFLGSDDKSNPYYSKKRYSMSITCRNFLDESANSPEIFNQFKSKFPNLSEEELSMKVINEYVLNRRRDFEINLFFEKQYKNFIQVFPFKDENGKVIQKAIKLISFDQQGKYYIPYTSWTRDKQAGYNFYCVPNPHKQILYNLHILAQCQFDAIVLTPSMDIAALNQNKYFSKICWISWLPANIEFFDSIDFEPLKNRTEPIYCLICNHSGNSIEDEYIKSQPIIAYLKEKVGINFKIIQMELKHDNNGKKFIRSLPELIAARPEYLKESIEILTLEEFEATCKIATDEQTRARLPFYIRMHPAESLKEAIVKKDEINKGKKDPIDYLVRPVIKARSLHMTHARRGIGKSNWTISLCAFIVTGNKIFDHKWWVVPRLKNKEQCRKIIYLDFEYEKHRDTIENDLKTFAYSLFPKDEIGYKKCKDNFIYKDCSSLKPDLTIASNHQQIFDIINDSKKIGEPDRIADLVVFDTYTKIVGGNDEKDSWGKLMPLFNQIKSAGSAIIVITHSSSDDPLKPRGFNHKEDDISVCLTLTKESINSNLCDPIDIITTKNDTSSVNHDSKPFKAYYDKDDKKWKAVDATKETELEEFAEISREYIKDDYSMDTIFQMMDAPKQTFYDKCYDTAFYFSTVKKMEIKDIAGIMGTSTDKVKDYIKSAERKRNKKAAAK